MLYGYSEVHNMVSVTSLKPCVLQYEVHNIRLTADGQSV